MTRKYESRLRAGQAEGTRDRILAAFAAQLATGPSEFSLAEVAQDAGVSLRTLHNHFPDERSRIEALARWIDEKVGVSGDAPVSPDDIGPYAGRMTRAFFRHEALLRAQLASGISSEIRRRRRRERERRLREIVGEAGVEGAAGDRVAAMIACVIGGQTAIALKDHAGLDAEGVEATIVWAADALMRAARRGEQP